MKNQIVHDHKTHIGASQAHRLVTYQQSQTLPLGAMNYVQDMLRATDEEFESRYESPAMAWGNANEVQAVKEIAELLECEVSLFGDNQQRIYAGAEYSNFLSALPDAIGFVKNKLSGAIEAIFTIEIKCLDTYNHNNIIASVGDDGEMLKKFDFAKSVQVQAQNICAEAHYQKPVDSIIVFFDPRPEAITRLHYIIIEPDHEFREFLKQRLKLAKALYDQIKVEPITAPVVIDAVLPATQLPVVTDDFNQLTPDFLKLGIDNMVELIAEHFGAKFTGKGFEGGTVFNCETQVGRDEAVKVKKQVTKAISAIKKLHEPIKKAAHEAHKKETAFEKGYVSYLESLREHLIRPLLEWEAEQKRQQQEIIEAEFNVPPQRDLNSDALAIYQQLDPVLYTKVVEAAKAIPEFEKTENQASFLNKLFDATKQGKALKQAFIELVRPKQQEAA